MSTHLALLNAAADALVRHPARSLIMSGCLAAILAPFLTGTAIFEAMKADASQSIEAGADLYVSLNRAGRNAPLPVSALRQLRAVPGVTRVVPRLVGRDTIVGPVVVVGLPIEEFPAELRHIDGALPAVRGEALVGRELASELNLVIGKSITLNVNPGQRLKIVGLFESASPVWSSRLVFVSLATAQAVFSMEGLATELLVYARPGYADAVAERLTTLEGSAAPLRVVSRRIAREMLRRGYSRRAGIFAAMYLVAFALAIPLIAVSSGFGFSERRREIGLYRAAGWQVTDVLELVLFENLILSLGGATTALALSLAWMKLGNGFFIAQFFLPEVGLRPGFEVTTRFLPLPALLAYSLALTLTLAGSLYNTYRTATVPPMEAIK